MTSVRELIRSFSLGQVWEVLFSLSGNDRVFPGLALESFNDPDDPEDHAAEPDNEPEQGEEKGENKPYSWEMDKDSRQNRDGQEGPNPGASKINRLDGPVPNKEILPLDEIEDNPSDEVENSAQSRRDIRR